MSNPEIGKTVDTGAVLTNYHDVGSGEPVLMLHGSGPGVSAFANWRLVLQALPGDFRLLAPDLAGFGYSVTPKDFVYSRQNWLDQIVRFIDAMGVDKVHVVGNSFGGSMALALAIARPERVNKIVLMGSVGVPFELTPGLDAVWGYTPSAENMRAIMKIFAYDQGLIGDAWCRCATRPAPDPASRNSTPACSRPRASAGSMRWRTPRPTFARSGTRHCWCTAATTRSSRCRPR